MLREILIVGTGSFFGGAGRYWLSALLSGRAGAFPLGTFVVNVLGCLLIGALCGWLQRSPATSAAVNLLFVAGFCGGFTTFSTFSKENLLLLSAGHYAAALAYALGSVVLGLGAVALGWCITRG